LCAQGGRSLPRCGPPTRAGGGGKACSDTRGGPGSSGPGSQSRRGWAPSAASRVPEHSWFPLGSYSAERAPDHLRRSLLGRAGGLASYGADYYESGRQAARLVDKILKGAKPAEIPAEVNTKIQFTINLKVAHALGLTIAPEMLYRADRLIR